MVTNPKVTVEEKYIDQLDNEELEELRYYRLVGIDPGMSDLLYCVDSDKRNQKKFRYSQNARRFETKLKRYRKILQDKKRSEHRNDMVEGRTIMEWEATMSEFNHKTLNFDAFKTYIQNKNTLNWRLAPFYNRDLWKKLKLGSYIKSQETEARMLNKFKKLFGAPETAFVCIGDWAQKNHRRHMEPVKGLGFRSLFRKAGYKVYLVDESYTSSKCSACEVGVCAKFRRCNNPRPHREGRILRHGLVKCSNCARLWNRDVNAASNIWKIADRAISGLEKDQHISQHQLINIIQFIKTK
jgi:hypothetical protein